MTLCTHGSQLRGALAWGFLLLLAFNTRRDAHLHSITPCSISPGFSRQPLHGLLHLQAVDIRTLKGPFRLRLVR